MIDTAKNDVIIDCRPSKNARFSYDCVCKITGKTFDKIVSLAIKINVESGPWVEIEYLDDNNMVRTHIASFKDFTLIGDTL